MLSNRVFDFLGPGNVHFEVEGSKNIGEVIKSIGGKKIFISTDKGIVRSNLLEGMISSIDKEGLSYTIYDDIEPNPSIETIEKGFEIYKQNECNLLVGFGGGSAIDASKAIGVLTTNPEPIKQYEGANKVKNPVPPIVALPTTAGTGSEVTPSSVITDKSRNYKMSIRSTLVVPKMAFLDPSLLNTLPQHIIASTGMDALVHAIESYISTGANPITEGLALWATKLISDNLRAFYADPDNIEAAGHMLIASSMAGISFSNARLGCIHAIAHALGGHYNIAHGSACAVLLPYAMEFSLIANPAKYVNVAAAMGEKTEDLPLMEAAQKAIEAVKALLKDIGIPENLSILGAKEEGVPQMAKDAVASGIHISTPRKIDLSGIEMILKAAL